MQPRIRASQPGPPALVWTLCDLCREPFQQPRGGRTAQFCSIKCRERARRRKHPGYYGTAPRAERKARRLALELAAQAPAQPADPAAGERAPLPLLQMLKNPNWAAELARDAKDAERDRRIAELEEAQRSPIAAAFGANLAAAVRESGGRVVLDGAPTGAGLAFGPRGQPPELAGIVWERGPDGSPRPSVIGPEHHHSAPEWADRVCYCGEPESPRPAGAAAAEVREEVAELRAREIEREGAGVRLEDIAQGEPVRGDTATLAAMREGY